MEKKETKTCTCNEKFKTRACPVHHQNKSGYAGTDNEITLTDNHMEGGKQIKKWYGHVFICPKCGEESIMHFHNYCPNCGQKVTIQSQTVTNYINQLST